MRKFSFFLTFLVCLLVAVVPAAALSLDGGYYVEGDSVIGFNRFYFPADFKSDALTLSDSGFVYNVSGVSGYFYCPDLPDYTFRFDRFGELTYRPPHGDSQPLNLTVTDTNIELITDASSRRLSYGLLIASGVFVICVLLTVRRWT